MVNGRLLRLSSDESLRQGAKHVTSLKEATALVLKSGDKRRRPDGVSKALFKEIRRLKLTQTAKIRKKKNPRH